ncbi:MAG: acyl-CoA carboxylase subunit beta [Christensenellales bacterium]|jgi:acetyl-CoA carboxylase carboxyltransferase component
MDQASKFQQVIALREQVLSGGGEEAVQRQHDSGKLSARERIEQLLDAGSFVEVDALAGGAKAPAQGVVAGYGTVDARPVAVWAQDYTVLGGAMGARHAAKIVKVMNMAVKGGMPVISLLDSTGARIEEGVDVLSAYGQIICQSARMSGVVPQLAAVLGPCVGAAAVAPMLGDFVFMSRKNSFLAAAGAQVLSASAGKTLSADQVGGAMANAEGGAAHFVAEDEQGVIAQIKQLLSLLPSNSAEDPMLFEIKDDLNRAEAALDAGKPADVRELIQAVVDSGSFLESQSFFATGAVTGFALLGGRPVGVVATQGNVDAGRISGEMADKAARFVRTCDAFNLPVVTFVDSQGLAICPTQEKWGLMRKVAALNYAYAEATVPMVSVVVGSAIGAGYISLGSRAMGADMVYAWPEAVIAPVTPDAATVILHGQLEGESADALTARQQMADQYVLVYANPVKAAEEGLVDDVITPAATRSYVIAALELLSAKRDAGLPKKHGNLPL